MRRFSTTLALAATALCAPLAAQQPETLPLVPVLAGSTRALALGGAYPIGATDSDAIFYNPAYGERLRGASLAVQWAGSASTLYTVSGATDWWGGALAIGVMALDSSARSERAALLAYARRVKGVRLALTGKLLEQHADAERNVTAAADIGAVANFSWLTFGLAAQNLGPGLEVAGRDYDLPMRALANASTQTAPLGPVDVMGTVQVGYTVHGDVIPAGGLELSWWPVAGRTYFLRLGGRRAVGDEEPYTLGAGFAGDKLILDYALEPYAAGASVHRFGVRWR